MCHRLNMCGYRFQSYYSDQGEKFYLAASPLLGPAEDLSAAADLIEVFSRTSAVARPNGQPRQAGVARGVRGHAPPPPRNFEL